MNKKKNNSIFINISKINPHLRSINLFPCDPRFKTGERKIYDHQFIYVHRGKGSFVIENTDFQASTGDLFFFTPTVSCIYEAHYKKDYH